MLVLSLIKGFELVKGVHKMDEPTTILAQAIQCSGLSSYWAIVYYFLSCIFSC